MRIRVRKARPRDLTAIAALDRTVWRRNRNGQHIPDGEHAWGVWIRSAQVLVAEDRGIVTGCALAFPCLDGTLCLHKLFVRASCRGRGIGQTLLAAMSRFSERRGSRLWLTTDPVNSAAVALYRKMGYRLLRRVEGFYRADEPRLVMIRAPASRTRGAARRQRGDDDGPSIRAGQNKNDSAL